VKNQNKQSLWRLVAKALGEKSGKDDKEADKIAIIRLLIMIQLIVTNSFIIANAVRHWNDIDHQCQSSQNKLAQTQKE
jgi:hypothetical protein